MEIIKKLTDKEKVLLLHNLIGQAKNLRENDSIKLKEKFIKEISEIGV